MKIVIAGGSGFLGKRLTETLAGLGYELVVLSRRPDLTPAWGFDTAPGRVKVAPWTPDGGAGEWGSVMEGAGAVINLAGESIGDHRWSAERKRRIRDSRLLAARSVVAAMGAARRPPALLVNASAIGYYGTRGNEVLTEEAGPGSGFLAGLCVEWEQEARAAAPMARVVVVRSGLVLEEEGGTLPRMLTPFRLFAGGPFGSGRQYVSWIHRADWLALIAWVLTEPSVDGPLNATAPTPVTNREFARAIGRALGRPSWLPAPAFALRAVLGEMADSLILASQRVVPARASQHGFRFRYPDLEPALRAILAPVDRR
jgi:hypothetical protein